MSHLSGLAVSPENPALALTQPARRSEGSLALSSNPAPVSAPRQKDSVEITGHTLKLVGTEETTSMRWDLIDRIREQIAAGTYDTPEKLDAALDRLAGSVDRFA